MSELPLYSKVQCVRTVLDRGVAFKSGRYAGCRIWITASIQPGEDPIWEEGLCDFEDLLAILDAAVPVTAAMSASSPVVVDDAMMERALEAFDLSTEWDVSMYAVAGRARSMKAMRAALQAALSHPSPTTPSLAALRELVGKWRSLADRCGTSSAQLDRAGLYVAHAIELEHLLPQPVESGDGVGRNVPCGTCGGLGWAVLERPSAMCPACQGSGRRT